MFLDVKRKLVLSRVLELETEGATNIRYQAVDVGFTGTCAVRCGLLC